MIFTLIVKYTTKMSSNDFIIYVLTNWNKIIIISIILFEQRSELKGLCAVHTSVFIDGNPKSCPIFMWWIFITNYNFCNIDEVFIDDEGYFHLETLLYF